MAVETHAGSNRTEGFLFPHMTAGAEVDRVPLRGSSHDITPSPRPPPLPPPPRLLPLCLFWQYRKLSSEGVSVVKGPDGQEFLKARRRSVVSCAAVSFCWRLRCCCFMCCRIRHVLGVTALFGCPLVSYRYLCGGFLRTVSLRCHFIWFLFDCCCSLVCRFVDISCCCHSFFPVFLFFCLV